MHEGKTTIYLLTLCVCMHDVCVYVYVYVRNVVVNKLTTSGQMLVLEIEKYIHTFVLQQACVCVCMYGLLINKLTTPGQQHALESSLWNRKMYTRTYYTSICMCVRLR